MGVQVLSHQALRGYGPGASYRKDHRHEEFKVSNE